MKGIFEKKNHFDIIAFSTDDFHDFPPLFHPHCELIYVREGFVETCVDGKEEKVTAGNFTLVFPYVTHSYISKSASVTVVLFDPAETMYEKEFCNNKAKIPYFADDKNIGALLERICALVKNSGEQSRKAAFAYLNAALSEVMLKVKLIKSDNTEIDNSKKILEYCSDHFAEQISLKSVSVALYLSESYVSKIFSSKFNYGFREYLNMLRINKAKKLLKSTDGKIVDIMLQCGYENQSSFNRVFKDTVGVSPKEYRRAEK